MTSYEFTGYVTEVSEPGDYDIRFILSFDKDVSTVKYPQTVQFKVSMKRDDLVGIVKSMGVGDKVRVKAFPWCKKGFSRSTGRPYCINENNASVVEVIEKAVQPEPTTSTDGDGNGEDPDNLPF